MPLEWLLGPRMQKARAPHHGADNSGDVDGVMASGHISGWVIQETGASVKNGEADVQDILFKLPQRGYIQRSQTFPPPSPWQ